MPELEVTWQRAARVWWLIVWRALLGGVLLGAVIGFIIGLIGAAMGWPQQSTIGFSTIAGALVSAAWGLVVVRMALRKKYIEFRLVLSPHSSN
jgi:hypothetical protein